MQVTVFGASGKVGQLVVGLLLEAGHQVVAFVHSKDPFGDIDTVRTVKGDSHNPDDIAIAIAGSDAVISTLGSWHTHSKDIVSSAVRLLIPAMETASISRIITVTGAAALASNDNPTAFDRANHALLKLLAPRILKDGEDHIALLEASQLAWTVVRSPIMTPRSSEKYHLDMRLANPLAIVSRRAVAKALVDQIDRIDFIQKAPIIRRS